MCVRIYDHESRVCFLQRGLELGKFCDGIHWGSMGGCRKIRCPWPMGSESTWKQGWAASLFVLTNPVFLHTVYTQSPWIQTPLRRCLTPQIIAQFHFLGTYGWIHRESVFKHMVKPRIWRMSRLPNVETWPPDGFQHFKISLYFIQ